MKDRWLILALLLVFLETGCVTGRRVVPLAIPSSEGAAAADKGAIFLASPVDNRTFQNKPPQPSIPSVDGDVNKLTPEQKASFIGRQRNTFGKALGDVVLPPEQTVPERAKLLVAAALKKRGYTIRDDPNTPNSASVIIDQFWGWYSPGMWYLSYEARIICAIKLKKGDKTSTFTVEGYGENHGQVASDPNWQLTYKRAFEDFLKNLDAELAKH